MSANRTLLFPDEIIYQILIFIIPKGLNSEIHNVNNFYLINKQFNKCAKIIADPTFYKELLFTTYLLGINNELKQKVIDKKDYKTIYFYLNQYRHLQQLKQLNKVTELKIGLFGKDSVGKISIKVRFVLGSFIDNYGYREETYRKQIVIDGKSYMIDVFDTYGQHDFFELKKQYYIYADCILTVCDLTNLKTLQEVEDGIEFCYKIKETNDVPIVIVGNKLDLIENQIKKREITKEMIDELLERVCRESNLKPIYFETSAKTDINIDTVFCNVVRLFEYKNGNWFGVVERLLKGENILKDVNPNKKCIVM
ncbi:hypothetical protein ABK040_011180 [Willaertia magna]